MPKTKEREAKESSKSSTRASAKSSAKTAAKPSGRVNGASQAKPAAKASSAKLPAASARTASAKPGTGAHQKPGTGAHAKPATASQTKPASAPQAKATATPVKPSSKTSAKIVIAPPKPKPSDRMERPVEKPLTNLKSPFTKDELSKWREQLLQRRNEISSDIAGLEKDAMEAEDGHTTPNHIAERGSDADLQDVSLGIAGEEKDIIWQIDRALRKIEESSPLPFGLCEFTKEPISRNRLQLIPWTPLSIEGANYMEENNMKVEDLLVDG